MQGKWKYLGHDILQDILAPNRVQNVHFLDRLRVMEAATLLRVPVASRVTAIDQVAHARCT